MAMEDERRAAAEARSEEHRIGLSSDEEFLFFEHKQISDEILFDRRVIIS